MKQEDKDLLIQDLCARLPYGVKCRYQHIQYVETGKIIDINRFGRVNIDGHIKDVCDIKPYLSPISSMTEEQKKYLHDKLIELELKALNDEISRIEAVSFEMDFYHKNHIDYRGLIPMGLALDATNKNIY